MGAPGAACGRVTGVGDDEAGAVAGARGQFPAHLAAGGAELEELAAFDAGKTTSARSGRGSTGHLRNVIFNLLIGGILVPAVVLAIPQYLL
ncbi:hypothetical protein FE391_46335, partial [Nonomuraea sp. KC401]